MYASGLGPWVVELLGETGSGLEHLTAAVT
jgi:hypothetical protein